jgi:hypothetical protein
MHQDPPDPILTLTSWALGLRDNLRRRAGVDKRGGEPLSPRTKAGYLTATTFFRDCQEWEWIPQGSDQRWEPYRASRPVVRDEEINVVDQAARPRCRRVDISFQPSPTIRRRTSSRACSSLSQSM